MKISLCLSALAALPYALARVCARCPLRPIGVPDDETASAYDFRDLPLGALEGSGRYGLQCSFRYYYSGGTETCVYSLNDTRAGQFRGSLYVDNNQSTGYRDTLLLAPGQISTCRQDGSGICCPETAVLLPSDYKLSYAESLIEDCTPDDLYSDDGRVSRIWEEDRGYRQVCRPGEVAYFNDCRCQTPSDEYTEGCGCNPVCPNRNWPRFPNNCTCSGPQSCTAGQLYFPECGCADPCTGGESRFRYDCQCRCPPGTSYRENCGGCASDCSGGQFPDSKTCGCYCPTELGYTQTPECGCVFTCPYGEFRDPISCECTATPTCPHDTIFVKGCGCKEPCLFPTDSYDQGTCECSNRVCQFSDNYEGFCDLVEADGTVRSILCDDDVKSKFDKIIDRLATVAAVYNDLKDEKITAPRAAVYIAEQALPVLLRLSIESAVRSSAVLAGPLQAYCLAAPLLEGYSKACTAAALACAPERKRSNLTPSNPAIKRKVLTGRDSEQMPGPYLSFRHRTGFSVASASKHTTRSISACQDALDAIPGYVCSFTACSASLEGLLALGLSRTAAEQGAAFCAASQEVASLFNILCELRGVIEGSTEACTGYGEPTDPNPSPNADSLARQRRRVNVALRYNDVW